MGKEKKGGVLRTDQKGKKRRFSQEKEEKRPVLFACKCLKEEEAPLSIQEGQQARHGLRYNNGGAAEEGTVCTQVGKGSTSGLRTSLGGGKARTLFEKRQKGAV